MTTAELINCCPWRLDQPRPLTAYEWTVVERAIHDGVATGKMYSAQTKAMAMALTMAVSKQSSCPAWTQSAFGPAPAVSTYAYGCLGSWWGGLDPASQQQALAAISFQGLLCAPNPPWLSCPRSQNDQLWRPLAASEYGEQHGTILPGAPAPTEPCAYSRQRSAYTPLTGAKLLELMTVLGNGALPPQIEQLAQVAGPLFANRSFVIGWQVKQKPDYGQLGSLATPADMLRLLDGLLEEAVIIWAPGQGLSIRNMVVTGAIDPAKLLALIQQLAPSMVGELLQQLPAWLQQQLPGILQNLPPMPGIDWTTVLGNVFTGFGNQTSYAISPATPASSGLLVVDRPGDQQDATPLPQSPGSTPDSPSQGSVKGMETEVLLALATVGLGLILIWRGTRTT